MPEDKIPDYGVVFHNTQEVVSRIQTRKLLNNKFQAIGEINSMYENKKEDDIFRRLRKVSKPAYELFDDLKEARNPVTNIAFIDIPDLTVSQKTMRSARLKELKNQGIIKKAKTFDLRDPIKKGSYMINPKLIMCPADQEAAEAVWGLL